MSLSSNALLLQKMPDSKVSPAKSLDKTLEKEIHLVWLGSVLRPNHLERMVNWKKLNPQHRVTVWIDAKFDEPVKKQVGNTDIELKHVSSLPMSVNVSQVISQLVGVRQDLLPPNFAAASDIYRFYILNLAGGWYVDTDVKPIKLDEILIGPQIKLCLFIQNSNYAKGHPAPSVIGASSKNNLMKLSIETIEDLSHQLTEEDIKYIRSNQASERIVATENMTGGILDIALRNLKIEGKPIYGKGVKSDILNLISRAFESGFEKTWIYKNPPREGAPISDLIPIDGIQLDDNHIKVKTGQAKIDDIAPRPLIDCISSLFNTLMDLSSERSLKAASNVAESKSSSFLSLFSSPAVEMTPMTPSTKRHTGPLFRGGVRLG